jgi:hypothetical protein
VGEVLTTLFAPGTPGSPEESLVSRSFTRNHTLQRREKVLNDTPSARAQGYKWDGTEALET